jgi:hippurate hydrolase
MLLRIVVSLFTAVFLCSFALAQEVSPEKLADAELPSLLTIYRDLHTNPELSTFEQRPAGVVAKELKAAGCEVTERVGKYETPGASCYGVVGVMKNGEGPVVLVRSDMDALPVHEETGAPFASKVTAKNKEGREVPVMHACGHDIHMTCLIGAARALSKLKDKWKGTIVFVGQPAEEIVTGAKAMMNDGLYTRWPKPNYALALHDDSNIEAGKIAVIEGYSHAAADSVDVTVKGAGGHGAYPHKTHDPIVLSAQIINAWQTIISREKSPLDRAVVTVGSIHGGTKHNIIPDEVKMQLTVRTYKPEVRQAILSSLDRIAKGCAAAAGIPSDRMPEVRLAEDGGTPSTYNNPELVQRGTAVLKASLGADNVVTSDPEMVSEDFCLYSLPDHSIPAFMFFVGAVSPEKIAESKKPNASPLPTLHSSKFLPVADKTIRTGVIGMTACVLDLMKR